LCLWDRARPGTTGPPCLRPGTARVRITVPGLGHVSQPAGRPGPARYQTVPGLDWSPSCRAKPCPGRAGPARPIGHVYYLASGFSRSSVVYSWCWGRSPRRSCCFPFRPYSFKPFPAFRPYLFKPFPTGFGPIPPRSTRSVKISVHNKSAVRFTLLGRQPQSTPAILTPTPAGKSPSSPGSGTKPRQVSV
jgi:hypothetical protein